MGEIAKLLGEEYKKLGKEELAELEKKVSKQTAFFVIFLHTCVPFVTN
jgi:hypothetical protein